MSAPLVRATVPRGALIDVSSPHPARFLARMLGHTLNHGMPGTRRGAAVRVRVARRGLPQRSVTALLRRGRRVHDAEVDAVLASVSERWRELAAGGWRLPPTPPPLSVLALQRRAGRTVFVFADSPWPAVVLKPAPDAAAPATDPRLREWHSLQALSGLGVAPEALGRIDGYLAQEGLPGWPLWLSRPVAGGLAPGTAAQLDRLGPGLMRLAEATARPGTPHDLTETVEVAAEHAGPAHTRRTVARVRDLLTEVDRVVLWHKDLSAQNWLVHGERFVGLVDWEEAEPAGVPGFDPLHAAVSLLEHSAALQRWDPAGVAGLFAQAWTADPAFERARVWQRRCVEAALGPEQGPRLADALLVAYFARRLGRHVQGGTTTAVGTATVAACLDTVCATTPLDLG